MAKVTRVQDYFDALIIRGDEMIPPKGTTALMPGDHVHIFARPEDREFILLMFGRPEEE